MNQKKTNIMFAFHSIHIVEGRRVILVYSACRLNIRKENWQLQHKSISCLNTLVGFYTSKRIIKLLQIISLWERITQEIQRKRSIGTQCSPFHVCKGCHSPVTSDDKSLLSLPLTRMKGWKTYSQKSTIKWEMFQSLGCVFQHTKSLSYYALWKICS